MQFNFRFSLLLGPPSRFTKYYENVYVLTYYKALVQRLYPRKKGPTFIIFYYFSFRKSAPLPKKAVLNENRSFLIETRTVSIKEPSTRLVGADGYRPADRSKL